MGAQQICLQMDKRRVFQIWTKQFFRMFDSPSIVGVLKIWLKMEKRKWRESWTKGFRLIGKENHRKITSKQCSNLKSLEAEITKRQPYKKTERRPYWKMALACVANQSWTELGPAQPQLVIIIIIFHSVQIQKINFRTWNWFGSLGPIVCCGNFSFCFFQIWLILISFTLKILSKLLTFLKNFSQE